MECRVSTLQEGSRNLIIKKERRRIWNVKLWEHWNKSEQFTIRLIWFVWRNCLSVPISLRMRTNFHDVQDGKGERSRWKNILLSMLWPCLSLTLFWTEENILNVNSIKHTEVVTRFATTDLHCLLLKQKGYIWNYRKVIRNFYNTNGLRRIPLSLPVTSWTKSLLRFNKNTSTSSLFVSSIVLVRRWFFLHYKPELHDEDQQVFITSGSDAHYEILYRTSSADQSSADTLFRQAKDGPLRLLRWRCHPPFHFGNDSPSGCGH